MPLGHHGRGWDREEAYEAQSGFLDVDRNGVLQK
jgi:hypothetical protein